jgi:hypothetical protein
MKLLAFSMFLITSRHARGEAEMWSLKKEVVKHAWFSIMLCESDLPSKTCYIVCHSMPAYFNYASLLQAFFNQYIVI